MSVQEDVGSQTSAVAQAATKRILVAIWFDMLPSESASSSSPLWARQVAQAHANNEIMVLAHSESAYARSGLVCEVVNGPLWPDKSWVGIFENAIGKAKVAKMQQIILMLPSRSSVVFWGQWSLLELARHGGGLDNLTGLLSGSDGWERALQRPDASRWLMVDRVITYGTGSDASVFLAQMRAFNPMARWVHEGFSDDKSLVRPISAYQKNVPLLRIPIETADLNAWGSNKVVYFGSSKEADGLKISDLFERWRQQYGHNIVRLWAVVRVKGVDAVLSVTSVHHLWASALATDVTDKNFSESRFWILGENLDTATLKAEFEACCAP